MNIPVVSGRPPTPEQETIVKAAAESWRKVSNEALVQAITRIEDAAKQLVLLTGTLQGIYFAVIAFSTIQQRLSGGGALLFLLPVVGWLLSMFCATQVFVPRVRAADLNDVSVDAWQRLRTAYGAVVDDKLAWLQRAHRLLVGSGVAVVVLLIAVVLVPAAPASPPTQIIILTPTPVVVPTTTP